MYQVRTRDGGTIEFTKTSELLTSHIFEKATVIEKISLSGPDGTRIRMVFDGEDRFYMTVWSHEQGNYVDIITGVVR